MSSLHWLFLLFAATVGPRVHCEHGIYWIVATTHSPVPAHWSCLNDNMGARIVLATTREAPPSATLPPNNVLAYTPVRILAAYTYDRRNIGDA